jgi:hypothetical protein
LGEEYGAFNNIKPFFNFWVKFQPEKNYFNLYKGFFMEKMAQIHHISKKKIPIHQIFMISSSR